MQEILFSVQGSSAEPYEVAFQRDESTLTAICTCQAGVMGQYCKHRIAILSGESTGIVSGNASDVALVVAWLPGTPLADALSSLAEAETEFDKAKKRVSSEKKHLARVMHR